MTAWPASLPQKPFKDGYDETDQEIAGRTKMDAGQDKVRRRFSASVSMIKGVFPMTTAQRATFETFYRDTIKRGALSFTWDHPITGTTETCRIAETPKITARGGDYWNVALSIEILP